MREEYAGYRSRSDVMKESKVFEGNIFQGKLFCGKCGAKRIMTEYGRMVRPDGSEDSFRTFQTGTSGSGTALKRK